MTDVCEVLTFYSAIYLCCFYSYLIQSNTICMQGGFNIIYEPPGCSSESYHDDKYNSNQIEILIHLLILWKHVYIYMALCRLFLSYLTTICRVLVFQNLQRFGVSGSPNGCPQLESFELGGVAESP